MPSSKVDDRFLKQFCLKYGIGPEYKPTAPQPNDRITECPEGYIGLYTKHFEFANMRIPFSLFFLDFLKHHKLHISQLSLMGAMKVTHFEIMCRALGGEPSLPLFRQFFVVIPKNCWYIVSQRRSRGCISSVPTSVPSWANSFFWVSADAVPFKMGWRQPRELLNVIPRNAETFDEKLYKLLVNHPTPLQPFPEHVLVMTGTSRNWPHLKAEPVIKDGDQEIDLLKYIEKGVGNAGVMRKRKKDVNNAGVMKLTSRSLAEHEVHILERTKGICYEGTSSKDVEIPDEGLQSEVQGTSGGDVEIHPENLEQKMVIDPEMVYEPASPSKKRKNVVVITIDDSPVQSSDETVPHTGNTHVVEVEASVSASNKRKGKQIEFTDESSSVRFEVGQTSVDQEYVPKSVPEVVTGWYERKPKMEARLRDRISRYRLRMTCQHKKIRKLVKKVRKLKKLSKYGTRSEDGR